MRTERNPTLTGVVLERTGVAGQGIGEGAAAVLPIAAAVALWAWVLAGVMAPLGGALARMAPDQPPLRGQAPPQALASTTAAPTR